MINEIYRSIQGESTRAGLPCIFVRLTGCDLRCTYCDSAHAFYQGKIMTLDEIMKRVEELELSLVEVTGGEPLLQPAVHPLMKRLADEGKEVLLETSGAHDIRACDPRVARIVDIKCPSSGESGRNRWSNLKALTPQDEIKFVIGSRTDFEWSMQIAEKHRLFDICPVLFSPVWKVLENEDLGNWIRESGVPARLQPQLHKILWGPRTSI